MLQNEPICPTCGDTILPHNHTIVDQEGDDLVVSVLGICPSCGNHYSWYDHFKYQGCSHVTQSEPIGARAI